MKEIRNNRPPNKLFHLCGMSRIGIFTETESKLVHGSVMTVGGYCLVGTVYLFGMIKFCIWIMVMDVQYCEST